MDFKRHADIKQLCRLIGQFNFVPFIIEHELDLESFIIDIRPEYFDIIIACKDILDLDQSYPSLIIRCLVLSQLPERKPSSLGRFSAFESSLS